MLRMRQKLKKLQKNFYFVSFLLVGSAVWAEPCVECNQLSVELLKVTKTKASYLDLKKKNEDFLKKPGISESAAIKGKSNLMIIAIKIETFNNTELDLQEQKKKLNCEGCQPPKSEGSKG